MSVHNTGKGFAAADGPAGPDALVTLAQLADLEVVAATIPVGIFRTEFDRGVVYANDRLVDIVGMSRAGVLGEGWTKAIHPDDRERVTATRAEVRESSGEMQIEHRIIRGDGSVRWIALRASHFFDDEGTPVGLVGAVADVTDRVLAEQDAARLSAVCEQTTDFVIVSGVDGRIIYSNASAQRVFGFDPTATAPDLERRYAESSRPRLAELLIAAAEHGTARGELSMLAADGREIPVSQVTLVHRTRDGGVECYSTIARDISREKSTERQLLLRGAKLRSLVEQAADLVIVLDERGIVTNVGESLRELTGAEPNSWVGRRLADLVHPSEADDVAEAFISCRFGGAGACEDVMYRIVRPDDSEIWFESRISNLLDDESVQAIVAISWDETERILVIDALRESEERFRSLAASSPLGIVYADHDGAHGYVNQRWRDIVGIGPDERASYDQIHPEDRDRVIADAQLVASERRTVRSEYRIVRPDGELRHLRSSVAPVVDSHGAVRGYVGSTEDVTDELGSRAHIDRLAALLESTPDLAFITDRLGRVLYANERAGSVLGMRVGSDLDFATFPLFGDTSQPVVRTEMMPGVRRDVVWTGELTLHNVDEGEVPVSVVTVAHRDDAGVVDFYSTIARDITRLKAVEARLIASESWFRSLVNEALDVVSVRDEANNIVYVSPSVSRVLGYDVDEIVNAPSRTIEVHPDDLPMLREAEAEARADPGRAVRIEYRLRHQDQSWRWVESRITNLLDDPSVHGIVTNSQDVTERRSAEDARARSDSALLALVQASPLAIYSVEVDLSVQLWNNACEELFGWSAGEVLGRHPPFVPDEALPTVESLIKRVFAGERIKELEIALRTRDERVVDAVLSLAPVRDAKGRVVSAMGVIVDVTARKSAEDGLRASQERFKALLHHASDFLVVYDDAGIVTYASPSVKRFTGLDLVDTAATGLVDLLHPDDLDDAAAAFENVTSGGSQISEMRMRRLDGGWRWMSITATDLRGDPDVGGVVINSRDVTEAREAVGALRESEERFRALVQHGSDMVSVINADGSVRYASPAGSRVLGLPEGFGLGADGLERVHPDDLDRITEVFGRALVTPGLTGPERFRLRAADDTYRTIEAVANNLVDEPAVNGLIVTAHDVTDRTRAEERVRQNEERLRALVQNLSDVITVVDANGALVYTSPAANRLFGFEDGDETWTDPIARVHADDRDQLYERMGEQVAGRRTEPIPFRIRHRDGSLRYVEAIANNLLDDPAVEGIVVTTRDVTERTRAESQVAAQARVLEMVAKGDSLVDTLTAVCGLVEDNVADSICSVMLVDGTGSKLHPSAAPSLPEPMVAALTAGIPIAEGVGSCGTSASRREAVVVTDSREDPLFESYRELMDENGLRACWSTPILASSDGRVLGTFAVYWREPCEPTAADRAVVDNLVHLGAIAIERKASETQLEFQAHHDPLTGLPNRALFLEFLTLALARARRKRNATAVLFLDLDEFKNYNDSLGHEHGDELLVAVGQRLRGVLRPGDTLARFGGDEFTVLCEDLGGPDAKQHAIEVAERLLEALRLPFRPDGEERFLSASVGIALAAGSRELPEDLLRDADAAMYRAKARGKARWELFDEGMRARARERLETESALHRALERREFRLFYQPIVSIAEARYVGVEALLRWQHPERGLVAPQDFVSLAEETGLIVPLGAWVLADVCRQYGEWRKDARIDPNVVVAMNLSAKQISHPGIVETVESALARSALPAANLCLEITESVLLDDTGPALKTLTELKELGVRLSMDDFGTGYSSLGYLKRFPIDSVKVDRSFVDGLGRDPEDSAIVAGVVSLGRALGLTVVGEGVETEGQLAALVELGCEQVQGFFFSPPRPANEIGALLAGGGPTLRIPGAALMRRERRPAS